MQHGIDTTRKDSNGFVFRAAAGTRILASDVNARENLWIEASALEHGTRARELLAFKPGIDWTSGLAASLRGQINFLTGEITRQGGVADNPVALASLTDLISRWCFAASHTITWSGWEAAGSAPVPAYVRRAEDFMRANAAAPVLMEQVAAVAGCSVRTLNAVFRQFRETTPLRSTPFDPAGTGACRTNAFCDRRLDRRGLTKVAALPNPGRFTAAYHRRFGESPAETMRRGSR